MEVIFTPDQEMEILTWLENLLVRGLSLQEVVDGMRSGDLTTAQSESSQ